MIEIANEQLVPIRDVPKRLPPRSNGRRIHISAVYRWAQRGVRGMKLDTVKIGGTTYTSIEALQRFAGRQLLGPLDQPSTTTTPAARRRQIEAAAKQVRSILGG